MEEQRVEEQIDLRPCSSAPLLLRLLPSAQLRLLGTARRYHLVDDPRHQHEETEHDRNP